MITLIIHILCKKFCLKTKIIFIQSFCETLICQNKMTTKIYTTSKFKIFFMMETIIINLFVDSRFNSD